MQLRRGLMMAMAGGAQFVKGTFTVPSDSGNTYVLTFDKTFRKFLFCIEMTDESKTELLNTGINAAKLYSLFGLVPTSSIATYSPSVGSYGGYRINPSTKDTSSIYNSLSASDSTSITIPCSAISSAQTNVIYKEYSYNYYIVEIK